MSYKKESSDNQKKLLILILVIPSVILSFLFLINYRLSHIPYYLLIIIFLIPFISLFISALINKVSFDIDELFTAKYFRMFPIIFYFDKKENGFEISPQDTEKINGLLQDGDIIVQHTKNYLHSLVLGQTTYFTHMGIFIKTKKDMPFVMHAIGHSGVCYDDLNNFLKCDTVAILRFSANRVMMEEHLNNLHNFSFNFINDNKNKLNDFNVIRLNDSNSKPGVQVDHIAYTKDVRTFILTDEDVKQEDIDLSLKELDIYDKLVHNIWLNSIRYVPEYSDYNPLVVKQAELLKGRPYDFMFNFVDFKNLSCVEFVWYCYKCLFPIHHIQRKTCLYFNWIKMSVIVPDMFVESDFFCIKYISFKGSPDKDQVKFFIRSHRVKFWLVILAILCSYIVVLILFSVVYQLGLAHILEFHYVK